MVDDKIRSRGRGPVQILTRQPAEACRREISGWRDMIRVHVCQQCGLIAIANLKKMSSECRSCRKKTDNVQVYILYACKLLIQEFMSTKIAVTNLTKELKTSSGKNAS
ncbi:hypothetical protein K7X08_010313 [Anisodus acutangulus]|uniref:DNA-directed RNA polymerase n=1 Tax=Anisodus acutangulus TaxID=402998 RepID=A0A9Q1RUD8_9SOLA|nr:hypothetical protein K7X08_010313 [Anisodus acutangulus]